MTASKRAYSPSLTGPRRTLAIGALLVYLASTIGIPLPSASSRETPEIALAACGCPLEAELSGTCCCVKVLPTSAVPGCCSKKKKAPSTAQDPKSVPDARSTSAQAAKPRGTRVMAFAARKCQGHSDSWLTAAMAVPLAGSVESRPVLLTVRVVSIAQLIPLVFADPPVPPPRLAHFLSAA